MNADHNYERTVDLAGFLKAVLLHWRQMIILGVLFALILGMIPILEYKSGSKASSPQTDEVPEGYLTQAEYNAVLKRLEETMADKKQYVANSYLMQIDPFKEVVARERIFVNVLSDPETSEEIGTVTEDIDETETNSEAATEETAEGGDAETVKAVGAGNTAAAYNTARVIREYVAFLGSRIDWSELAEELGTEPRYIDECVSADSYMDSALIVISVKGFDADIACAIRDYAVEKMADAHAGIEARICGHELNMADGGVEVLYDASMRTYQESLVNECATTQTRYDNFRNSRSSFVYNAPVRASLNKKAVLSNAVTGFIAGALIGAMINIILIFVRGRVISSKELLLSYDIKTLADLRSIERTGIGSGIDRRIENIGMGGDGKLSDGERIQKAAQLVELYAHNAENIVLIGDVSEDTLKTTAERLQQNLKGINLKYCVTLLGNNTLLRESDGVILVEKRNESRLGMIESDIGVIGEMKIPVIGVILL